MNKILLTGDLAEKFAPEVPFAGASVKEAFQCLDVNFPEFRKYLIDASENDMEYHVEIGGKTIDEQDAFLNLVDGDILVTPIPAGSKSGGQKVLAAAAIATLFILPQTAPFFLKGGFVPTFGAAGEVTGAAFAASGGLTTAGSIAAAVATNLALTGIQQLLAPDPGTDKEEDAGYLFNGAEQLVIEGAPVPILYGQLAVPGYPVSFEILPEGYNIGSPNHSVAWNGDISHYPEELHLIEAERDEYTESGTVRDTRGTPDGIDYAKGQTVVFTDLISEGPIHGLLCGGRSVLLNGDPAQTEGQSVCYANKGPKATVSGNTLTTPTIHNINTELGDNHTLIRSYINKTSSQFTASVTTGNRYISINLSSALTSAQVTQLSEFNFGGPGSDPKNSFIVRLMSDDGELLAEGRGYVRSTTRINMYPKEGLASGAYSGANLAIDLPVLVTGASGQNLSGFNNVPNGSYNYDIQAVRTPAPTDIDPLPNASKYQNFSVEMRNGHLMQEPFHSPVGAGLGNVSLPGANFETTELDKFLDGSGNPSISIGLTANAGFNIRSELLPSIAELRITFSYSSLFNTNIENGQNLRGTVAHRISIGGLKVKEVYHIANSQSTVIFQERITFTPELYDDLSALSVQIERLTFNDKAVDERKLTGPDEGYTATAPCSIAAVGAVLKEKLFYPHTAIAQTQVSSRLFQSVPTRAYECRGVLIRVPSNYKTREETGGDATYTGAFDGSFREDRTYCNNPAWVLWDLITHPRYGLGDWIEESDLNIYAFYKVARFCDEQVPAHVGDDSTEPRFTTNVYLRTKSEAYKVIKDLSSIFTGILYWMDGEVSPIADTREYPVYIFNPSNIIDGNISYETTGTRTRTNQVIVSWNNPENNYKIEPLVVEDQENIVKTGQIVSESASAFGATSYGQALRYGRWKLWTATNQTEIISFKTAINAAFLQPGDVITVPKINDTTILPSTFSGRIIDVTANGNWARIDKYQELINAGYDVNSMECIIVLTDGVAKSIEPSNFTHTDGSTIAPGEIVPGITTELAAFNYRDNSGDLKAVQWLPYTFTATLRQPRTRNGEVGWFRVRDNGDSLPTIGAAWSTTTTATGQIRNKEYRILGITENDQNNYTITAVEYFLAKFDSIDDRFILNIEDPVYKIPKPDTEVPAPKNVYVVVGNLNSGALMDDVTLYFDPPQNEDESEYDLVAHYEVEHAVPGIPNPVIVNKSAKNVQGLDITPGTHTIGMRTVNTFGQRSLLTKTTFVIRNPAKESVPRSLGIVLGATVSSRPKLDVDYDTDGTTLISADYTTDRDVWAISPAGNPRLVSQYTSLLTQDVSAMPSKDFDSMTDQEKTFASAYIFYDDSDKADPFKLIVYKNLHGIQYVHETADGAEDGTGFVEVNSAITIGAGSVKVVGADFTTNYEIGDTLLLEEDKIAKVAYIASATDMRIDRSFPDAITDATPAKLDFRPHRDNDCVFAQIRHNNNVFEWYPINLVIDQFLGAGIGRELIFARTEEPTAPSDPDNAWGYNMPDPEPNPVGDWTKTWYNSAPNLGPDEDIVYYYLWQSWRKLEGSPGDGDDVEDAEWSTPVIISHWGRDGNGEETIFRRTVDNTAPSAYVYQTADMPQVDDWVPPTDASIMSPETNWTDDPPSPIASARFVWGSTRKSRNGVWGEFGTPFKYTEFGRDGAGLQYSFRATADVTNPGAPTSTPAQRKDDNYVPTGWSDNIIEPTDALPIVWVTTRTKTQGAEQWTEWQSPTRFLRNTKDGNGWEFIFAATEDQTPRPVNPTPSPKPADDSYQEDEYLPPQISGQPEWMDDPVSATETLRYIWVSSRRGNTGEWSDFTDPAIFAVWGAGADGAGFEVIFLRNDNTTAPAAYVYADDDDKTENDFVPTGWQDDPLDPTATMRSVWASIRRKGQGATEWGDFETPTLWARWGRDGVGREYIYASSASNTAPALAATSADNKAVDDFIPDGWEDDPPDGTPSATMPFVWVASRRGATGLWSEFSSPSIYARWGRDGAGAEFIYRRTANDTNPGTPTTTTTQDGEEDHVPANWTDNPVGTSLSRPYEWVSTRKPDGVGTFTKFSTPAVWSKFGADGESIEFIFRRNNSSTAPALTQLPITNANTQVAEYTPDNWGDDPPSPTVTAQYVWVAKRKKVNEVWQLFGTPGLWAKWGADGEGVDLIFIATADKTTVPDNPTPADTTTAAYQNATWSPPGNWSRTIPGVTDDAPIIWVSKRIKVRGVWSAFDAPAIWVGEGAPGDDGKAAPQSANGYVYWHGTGIPAAAPSNTGVAYDFDTGVISSLPTNWQVSPPQITDTQTTVYYSYFHVIETTYVEASNTYSGVTITFGDPTLGTSFSGLVTFTTTGGSQQLQSGGTTLTQIDGGTIRTGTIALNRLQNSQWQGVDSSNNVIHRFALSDSGVSIAGHGVTGFFYCNDASCYAVGALGGDDAEGAIGALASAGNTAVFFRNNSSGTRLNAVQIGTGTAPLTIYGGTNGTTNVLTVNNAGTVTSVDSTITSDIRVKDNLEPITSALDKITKLTGYTYDMFGERRAGLVAQEVEKVLPEAVKDNDGQLTLSPAAVLGLIVESIKELKEQVDAITRER